MKLILFENTSDIWEKTIASLGTKICDTSLKTWITSIKAFHICIDVCT